MSRQIELNASTLGRRFGPGVLCGVIGIDGDPDALLPTERAAIAAAVPARRREFAAGRTCARELLARLGFAPDALLPGPERAPRWPAGAIGSISHDRRRCAVVVARAQRFVSLGIDLEPDEPLEEELWPTLFLPRELERLQHFPRLVRGRTARMLFSAKESVYKCLHPLFQAPIEFHDVEIVPVPDSDRFRARLCPALRLSPALRRALPEPPLHGFHLEHAGSILTGAALARAPSPAAERARTTGVRA